MRLLLFKTVHAVINLTNKVISRQQEEMASVDLRKVRETLESLKDFDIDEQFHTTPFDSATLLPRYEQVRDEYLKRRILHAFIAEAEKESPSIEAPTEEEQAALEMRQREVFSNLVAQIHNFQTAKADLQSKYAHFTTKRENLHQLMKEMENMNTAMEDDSMEDDTDVDEEELAHQEEQLLLLQQQAASLKAEIAKVQNESRELEVRIEKLEVADENVNPTHLEQLRLENEKLESEVQRLDEVQEFYEKLVAVMEELSGIRIIGLEPATGPDSEGGLVFAIEVLGSHRIQIGLQPDQKSPEDLRVVYVKLLSSPLIQSHEYAGEEPVRLTIPEFSDLVEMSDSCPPGDNLRFVVRESVARIQILEARLGALVDLKTESGVVVKIGKLQRTNGILYGSQNQEVVCSLDREQVAAVLSLTPDCPLCKNSVYISQMVGLGGWSEKEIADLQETVNASGPFARPVEVIRSLRAEIHRRVANEGLALPLTPKLPVMGQGFNK